ncbi:MAG TPA: hypothetical protein VFS21_24075 [Roseiflexaceae bacterium]|nr:hypothetical protein [Roseiflexaceae bacterium]
MNKIFPDYVHCIVNTDDRAWPVEPQGYCECDYAATANALNLLAGERRYSKDEFIRMARFFFQPRLGGTISPIKVWQMRWHGFGTHFGNLSQTNYEFVLRDLVDRGVPTIVEIGVAFKIGKMLIYGRHSIVLVGYSDPYRDVNGQLREEYYFVDSQWPVKGPFDLTANDVDRDGDGIVEVFPGNRTMSREDFRAAFPTGLYFPVFRSKEEHKRWYMSLLRSKKRIPIIGWLSKIWLTGSFDVLIEDTPSDVGKEVFNEIKY